jgi:DNA-binding transcriptional MerR regulator
MAARAFIKKTPYLDTEDTLEEVGISRRQLNYWREKELFTPELGSDANKFTEKDIKLLKFAQGLIVEQQFPVEVAKRLIEAATSANSGWQEIELEDFQYLDVKSGTLLSKKLLESLLWDEFGASATEKEVEDRLYDLTLLLFRLVRSTRPSPTAYAERRDEILQSLYAWEMAARLSWGPTSGNPQPHVHVDPELYNEFTGLEKPEEWLLLADRRLQHFEIAANLDGANSGNWGRFFSSDAVQGAHHSQKPALTQGVTGSIGDVPWDDGEPPF